MKAFILLIAIAGAGCIRSTTFKCDQDSECAGAGTDSACTGGFCTFADSTCSVSGRRYADNSGASSGQCVGEGDDRNPGNEPNPPQEAGGEPMPMGCPGNYAALPNSGSRGHRYRLIDMNRTWTQHRDGCSTMGTFLAYPDGPEAAMELAALTTLAGNGAWIGATDAVAEGTYRRSLDNMPISSQTQALVSDGDGGDMNEDCLAINGTTIDDASCDAPTRKAVCECVP